MAAGPAAGGPGDDPETVLAPPSDAGSPSVRLRRGQRYFLICFNLCLILFITGLVGINKAAPRSGLSYTMGWVIGFSLAGALLSLAFFLGARVRQVAWALVPILSLTFLASVPFLWLALIRRRVRDWAVFAAYLAATVAEILFFSVGSSGNNAGNLGGSIFWLVAVVAPVHALVAFRPGAGVLSWRNAHAGPVADKRQQPIVDAVPPQDWQQDAAPGHSKPTPTDSGGATAN